MSEVRAGAPVTAFMKLTRRRAMPAAAGACPERRLPAPRGTAMGLIVAFTALIALLVVPAAHGEEVFTRQAAAANATDSTWIPAPAQRAALCIVDTGNDVNPDTSNVVARLSVDGGDGSDRNPDHHGTLMSMIASAPYNGFGMVGAAPTINVVSVRASRDGRSFGGTDLARAVQKCVSYRSIYNIKVVSLSLGGAFVSELDASSMATTEDMVDTAHRGGLNVVAAAGNHVGGVDWPAAYGPVLAVGAADSDGVRCTFAADGPQIDLWAAGCPVDAALPDGTAAWASGSSESAAYVAGALTQLRGLVPSLTSDDAERVVTDNARTVVAGRLIDVGNGFRAIGLASSLAEGSATRLSMRASTPTPSSWSTTDLAPASGGVETAPRVDPVVDAALRELAANTLARSHLPKPMVRSLAVRRGLLTLVLRRRPGGADAFVRVYARRRRGAFPTLVSNRRLTGDQLRVRISGILSQVSITYRDPSGHRAPSAPLNLDPRR